MTPAVVAVVDAVAIVAVVAAIAVVVVVVTVAAAAVVMTAVAVPLAEVLQVVALLVVVPPLAVVLVAVLPVVAPRHSKLAVLRLNVGLSLSLPMFKPLASNVQDTGLLAESSMYTPTISRQRSTRARFIITMVRTPFYRRRVYLTGPPPLFDFRPVGEHHFPLAPVHH